MNTLGVLVFKIDQDLWLGLERAAHIRSVAGVFVFLLGLTDNEDCIILGV